MFTHKHVLFQTEINQHENIVEFCLRNRAFNTSPRQPNLVPGVLRPVTIATGKTRSTFWTQNIAFFISCRCHRTIS